VANVVELVAVVAIVAFVVGATFGVILIVVAGIKAEENVARKRNLARRRATTLYDEPAGAVARGVRWVTTGRDAHR
jgi:hypothetical protein